MGLLVVQLPAGWSSVQVAVLQSQHSVTKVKGTGTSSFFLIPKFYSVPHPQIIIIINKQNNNKKMVPPTKKDREISSWSGS